MLNYSSFCFSSAATGLFLSKPEVVIASSPQLLVGFRVGGWPAATECHSSSRFETCGRSLWRQLAWASANSLLHRALARIAGFLYRNCDHIVVVTPAFKEYLVRTLAGSGREDFGSRKWSGDQSVQPRTESSHDEVNWVRKENLSSLTSAPRGNAHGLQTLVEAAARLLAECAQRFYF